MIEGKKVVVVLPAYNADRTLSKTVSEIPLGLVDEMILTDDHSSDKTLEVARSLGIDHILSHITNKGYGANQKTCYDKAIEIQSDIIIMLHPDYQYSPKLIPSMAHLIASDVYDVVMASRIIGGKALKGGMPLYKYFFNRVLTFVQNLMTGSKLSEYHTGYRAFNRNVLTQIPYQTNSDNFVFDNQILSQIIEKKFRVGEISCPTKYDQDSSSINIKNSFVYGFGVLSTSFKHLIMRVGIYRSKLYR